MQSLLRLVCICYLVYMTALLLVADPTRLVMRGDLPLLLRMLVPMAHLLSFSLLAVLALAARWPAPRWMIVVFLVLYAGTTEVAQSCLPPRTAEWADWLQDLAGIAGGAALCWVVALAAGALAGLWRQSPSSPPPGTSDEWEVVRNVMRPPAGDQSWWC